MKKINLLILAMLVSGCTPTPSQSSETITSIPSQTTSETSVNESSNDSLTSTIDSGTESSETVTSEEIESSMPVTSEEESSVPSLSEDTRTGTRKLNFYGINDFHGAIIESNSEPGIFKLGSYLKDKYTKNPEGSIFINAGDYWQGSSDSNLNRGAFLTEAMNILDVDSFTLGNHEFDWFDTTIEANKARADYPFLGANVISKETNTVASNLVHYDDTFKASVIVEKNDVKVGIVGTTGSNLESSILGTAIAPYSFNPVDTYIRSEVANLKALGADVIALSTHDSLYGSTGEYAGIINDRLVDVIFSAHQHAQHNEKINGIPVLQTNGYGKQVMEVDAMYDFDEKTFFVEAARLQTASVIKSYPEDPELLELFNTGYADEINAIKNEVVGTLTSDFSKSGLVNLANQLMSEYVYATTNLTNVVAVHNLGGVRVDYGLPAGEVKYGDIYRAFPFDNEVMIIENISGSDLNRLISGDYYSLPDESTLLSTKMYTLVTIDFISFRDRAVTLSYEQTHTYQYVRELVAGFFRTEQFIDGNNY